jgi:16S rRNA (uracil1498-N3)-methyltransferase
MRRFFVDPVSAGQRQIAIPGPEAGHIRRVLRLKPGERVTLVDGSGWEYTAVIRSTAGKAVDLEILERVPGGGESPLTLVLAQAYLKDRKGDDLIRPLTELGVAECLFFPAQRSVALPRAGRAAERRGRWERIAREGVKQCGRARVPVVREVESLDAVLALGSGCQGRFFFWEEAPAGLAQSGAWAAAGPVGRVLAVVGPEGGFTPEEAAAASRAGFTLAGLGPRILRADTAALTACALLQHRWGDLGRALPAG